MWKSTYRPSTSWDEPPPRIRGVRLLHRLAWTLTLLSGVLLLTAVLTSCGDLHYHPIASLKPGAAGMADLDVIALQCQKVFP